MSNVSAPTADLDRRVVVAFESAAAQLDGSTRAEIESLTIDAIDDVESAVADLAQRGVTVVVGTCDRETTGALLEAATNAGLLGVTGCAALPSPVDPAEFGPLFIDLASLQDSGAAMALHAAGEGLSRAATIRSTLVNDIAGTCLDFEASFVRAGGDVAFSGEFAALTESPGALLDSSIDQLDDIDLFVVCSLPAALNETIATIRIRGFDQPIVVPWFDTDTPWDRSTTNVVVVATAAIDDDPEPTVADFFRRSESTRAADIVAADAVHRLVAAADRAASVGALRLEAVLLGEELEGVTGLLAVDPASRQTTGRAYRVIEVSAGQTGFVGLVSVDG